jgi:hypothetical protein
VHERENFDLEQAFEIHFSALRGREARDFSQTRTFALVRSKPYLSLGTPGRRQKAFVVKDRADGGG